MGRREQLALLDEAMGAAQAGVPGLVLLGGDAGIGKTRLLDHFADRLTESGVGVLRTACVELGAEGLPLAPVSAALRQLIGMVGLDALTRDQPGVAALLRLLPEYGVPADDAVDQVQLFDLYGALLHRLGTEHALVWIVDDLHWTDRSTRDLVGFLARTMRGTRVLVVVAYRSDDLDRGHPLRPFLADLQRMPGVRRTELSGLTRAETAELVGSVTGSESDELADRVYRRSGGNALFATELARTRAGDELPDSLRDLLLRRLGSLDDTARDVVRRAAVGGRAVSHRLLEATTMLPRDELLGALRAAADRQLLLPEGDGYMFRHALVRDAVAGELLPAERRELHRVYAEALAADPGLVPPDRVAAEAAYHWHEAGDSARALPALLDAAAAAGRVAAHAERAQLLSRALAVWPDAPVGVRPADVDRLDLYESAIAAATWAGDDRAAIGLVDRALEVPGLEPVREAMLHGHRGMALHNLGRTGALVAVEESLRVLGPADPAAATAARVRVLDLLASILVLRGRSDRAVELSREAIEIAVRLGELDLQVSAQSTLGWAHSQLGAYDEALAVLRPTLELAGRCDNGWQLARVQLNLAKALDGIGAYDEAVAVASAGLETARVAGVERTLGAVMYVYLTSALAATGRWRETEAAVAKALELDAPPTSVTAFLSVRAEIALARGEVDAARADLEAADAMTGSPGELAPWMLLVTQQQAELALAENRFADARRTAEEALAGGPRPGRTLAGLAAAVPDRPGRTAIRIGQCGRHRRRRAGGLAGARGVRGLVRGRDRQGLLDRRGAGMAGGRAPVPVGRRAGPGGRAGAGRRRPPGRLGTAADRRRGRRGAGRDAARGRDRGAGPECSAGHRRGGVTGRGADRTDRAGDGGTAAGRCRPVEQGDRHRAVHQRQDGERARVERAGQVRRSDQG